MAAVRAHYRTKKGPVGSVQDPRRGGSFGRGNSADGVMDGLTEINENWRTQDTRCVGVTCLLLRDKAVSAGRRRHCDPPNRDRSTVQRKGMSGMREELQKEIDELGLGEDERALFETELNRGDYDAVVERLARAQNTGIPGVTNGTLTKFRAIFSEVLQLKGEIGVRRQLSGMRAAAGLGLRAADHGHPTLLAVLDLMEREFLPNGEKPSQT
jgi:hypothetical protein